MKHLSVLQLGDVHFPESQNALVGDVKDNAVSSAMRDRITQKKLRQVIHRISTVRTKNAGSAMLICGDLTTFGSIDGYRECVAYLNDNLALGDGVISPLDSWHVVPGNHDLERKLLKPNETPFPVLFEPLRQIWTDRIHASPLPIDDLRATVIRNGNVGLALYSLNSCFGCGEWRSIPNKMIDSVQEAILAVLGTELPRDRFHTISEQLDAPAFDQQHLTTLCTALDDLDTSLLPIVLAHHNLLPQATPRIQLYTELVNSGILRARLSRIKRSIVYCHGHIHDDPVEVLVDPLTDAGRLIVVSAPLLESGFNVLTVWYRACGLPVGLEVFKYRITLDGDVPVPAPIRIPLCGPAEFSRMPDRSVQSAIGACTLVSEPLEAVRDRLGNTASSTPRHETLRDWLLEAEWFGFVELENRNAENPKDVRIRKVTP